MSENCLFCGGPCNETYSFGYQPCVTRLTTKNGSVTLFPLVLQRCGKCDLFQVSKRAGFLFDESYPIRATVAEYYQSTLRDFYRSYNLSKDAIITDIGCNDGNLLSVLSKLGFSNLYGFEPVSQLANQAVEVSGAKVVAEPFSLSSFGRVPKSDLVICNHTFHQIERLNETIEALKLLVKPQGRLIIEVPDFEWTVKNNAWDMIAHENLSYFTQSSMLNIMSKYFGIEKVTEVDYPVPSKRYTFVPKQIPDYNFPKEHYEFNQTEFRKVTDFQKLCFLETLVQWKKMHRLEIAAFGACSKAVSFFNFLGVDRDIISYCIDETPGKFQKLMPKSGIPIISLNAYRELTKKPDIMLITTWNYARELKEKINHPACWVKTPAGDFKRV